MTLQLPQTTTVPTFHNPTYLAFHNPTYLAFHNPQAYYCTLPWADRIWRVVLCLFGFMESNALYCARRSVESLLEIKAALALGELVHTNPALSHRLNHLARRLYPLQP